MLVQALLAFCPMQRALEGEGAGGGGTRSGWNLWMELVGCYRLDIGTDLQVHLA